VPGREPNHGPVVWEAGMLTTLLRFATEIRINNFRISNSSDLNYTDIGLWKNLRLIIIEDRDISLKKFVKKV